MTTDRVYFHVSDQTFSIGDTKPGVGWRTLPKRVGIIWHDDQSQNQIVLTGINADRHDYIFNPLDDIELLKQYADQLADILS